jgi:hypothetical protein
VQTTNFKIPLACSAKIAAVFLLLRNKNGIIVYEMYIVQPAERGQFDSATL